VDAVHGAGDDGVPEGQQPAGVSVARLRAQPRAHDVDEHHVEESSYSGTRSRRVAAELSREEVKRRGDGAVATGEPSRDVEDRWQLRQQRVSDVVVVVVGRAQDTRARARPAQDDVTVSRAARILIHLRQRLGRAVDRGHQLM
jgi:hypothetical protein